MATINTTDEKFDEQVLKNEKHVLVDFWAEWCGPCKMVGPILEEISDEMSNVIVIAKHNIDSEPNAPTKYGVRGIPTMLLFQHNLIDREQNYHHLAQILICIFLYPQDLLNRYHLELLDLLSVPK